MIGSLLLSAQDDSSATAISWTGETVITDERTYTADHITVEGNLTITGKLTLIGTELEMDCPSCGTYAIDVKNGGSINILSGSEIHASNPGAHYLFRVWPGSALTMNNSKLQDCGWIYNGSTPLEDRGLYINSSTVSITNSTIARNNIGIVIDNGTSPFISGNNISSNDDNAIVVRAGSVPLVDNNIISSNMRHAWNDFSGAIDSEASSPVITNNTISDNLVWGIELAVSGNPIIMYNRISGHKKEGYGQASGIWSRNNNADIRGNNISNNTSGISLSRGSSKVTGNIINDNLGDSIVGDGYGVLDGSTSTFANNSYNGNSCGICFWDRTASSYDNETLKRSSRAGVEEYGSSNPFSVVMTNCSFSRNNCDVLLQAVFPGSNGGTLDMIDPVAVNFGVSVSDPAVSLKVRCNLDVSVIYENGSIPVPGASVNITDAYGARAASLTTGGNGRTGKFLLEACNYAGGMSSIKTPFNISAAKDARSNIIADFPLLSSRNATVILDDIPPVVRITAPADGTLTSRSVIAVSGVTERKVSLQVNGKPVDIGPDGEWSLDVPLRNEGRNEIRAEVVDGGQNLGTDKITVFRDTVAPVLNITSPIDGFLTNRSVVVVEGTISDPEARVTVNGVNVTAGPTGMFSKEIDLAEGFNTITIDCRDAAGNVAQAARSVEKDSVPPMLVLLKPADGLLTTLDSVTICGSADADCSVAMNGQPVSLDMGRFTVQARLEEGVNGFMFSARDRAGNENLSMLTVFRDSTAPVLEIASPREGQLLNVTLVEVRGTTEAGAVIRINGADVTLSGSSFSAVLTLAEGQNTITIEATDALENTALRTVTVYVDTRAPFITIKAPSDRALTNRTAIEVRGFTEPGASLTVNGMPVQVEPSGSFNCMVELDLEGANRVTVQASDAVNNTATAQVTILRDTIVYYNITSPGDGTRTKERTVVVVGSAEAGSTITVGGLPVYPAPDWTFSQAVALAYGANLVNITIKDPAGNTVTKTLNVTRVKPAPPPPAKSFIPGFTTVAAFAAAAIAMSAVAVLRRKRY